MVGPILFFLTDWIVLEKSCQSLAAGCVRLVNDLTILDSTKQQHLDSLQFLDGSLTMKDTKMRKLALPNLTHISSSKGPFLVEDWSIIEWF